MQVCCLGTSNKGNYMKNKIVPLLIVASMSTMVHAAQVDVYSSGAGWNLVGACGNTDISTFLNGNTATEIEQIQDKDGNSYSVSRRLGTLSSLVNGNGYWVKALSDVAVDAGALTTAQTVSLASSGAGWNLIGVCKSGLAISDLLGSNTATEIEQIQDKDGNSYSVSRQLGTLSTLEIGKGYWVKVLTDTTIVVDTNFDATLSDLSDEGVFERTVTTTSEAPQQEVAVTLPAGTYNFYADTAVSSTAVSQIDGVFLSDVAIADSDSSQILTGSQTVQVAGLQLDAGDYVIKVSKSVGDHGAIWVGVVASDATYEKSGTLTLGSSAISGDTDTATLAILQPGERHNWSIDFGVAGSYTVALSEPTTGNPLEDDGILLELKDSTGKSYEQSGRQITVEVSAEEVWQVKVGAASESQGTIGTYNITLTKN
jgi:hypothetical protein